MGDGWLTPRPGYFTYGKETVGVWTGAENFTTAGFRSPDRPASSEWLYRLSCSIPHHRILRILLSPQFRYAVHDDPPVVSLPSFRAFLRICTSLQPCANVLNMLNDVTCRQCIAACSLYSHVRSCHGDRYAEGLGLKMDAHFYVTAQCLALVSSVMKTLASNLDRHLIYRSFLSSSLLCDSVKEVELEKRRD